LDTLTRMQAFVDVVDEGGFSAAARKVGRSKALMSKYVRELEDELGILLLNRTTRQFSLTEAGKVLHKSALEILQKVGDLQDTVREAGKGHKGRLRISAPRSLTDLEIGLPIVEFMMLWLIWWKTDLTWLFEFRNWQIHPSSQKNWQASALFYVQVLNF